ncbi:hypothetical protein B4Q13_22040 [Lacticaseibacillus rhamnosus]
MIEVTADLGMAQTVIYEQGKGIDERVQVAFTVNMRLTATLTLAVFASALGGVSKERPELAAAAIPLVATHPNLLVVQTMSKSRALAARAHQRNRECQRLKPDALLP